MQILGLGGTVPNREMCHFTPAVEQMDCIIWKMIFTGKKVKMNYYL